MSDFLNDIQCDELVNGQSFDGQYVPTDQDLADMNEAWQCNKSSCVTNCDYCSKVVDCFRDEYGSTCCDSCHAKPQERADWWTGGPNFFCANCGHVELVGNAQSPDESLCCDCYKYNRDIDCDDYIETESDVYQDSSYDDYPEMDW